MGGVELQQDLTVGRLVLRGFRNYKEAELCFAPDWNSLFGTNAQGKTNILEALYFLATGRSFRTRHLQELLRQGEEAFFLELDFQRGGVGQTLRVWSDGRQRRIWHNQTLLDSLRGLLGRLPTVYFGPDDVQLIKGSPTQRRYYLDLQMAQVDALYVHHLARYQRALKQRNTLLRRGQLASIEIWEEELVQSGAYLIQKRRGLVADLAPVLQLYYQSLSGEGNILSLTYQPAQKEVLSDANVELALRQAFDRFRSREQQLGNTLVGPHRDDVELKIGTREVKIFASEGQQRSTVAALRLAEWARLRDQVNMEPLLLVDDVGVSLDSGRRQRLFDLLAQCGQVCVSAPDPWLSGKQERRERAFEVKEGCLERVLEG